MNEQPKTIKVRVELSVEIDVELYRLNYGGASIAEIREQIKAGVADAIRSGGFLAESIVGVEEKGTR
jgi:uncharacterized alkaline shock family protein YloU